MALDEGRPTEAQQEEWDRSLFAELFGEGEEADQGDGDGGAEAQTGTKRGARAAGAGGVAKRTKRGERPRRRAQEPAAAPMEAPPEEGAAEGEAEQAETLSEADAWLSPEERVAALGARFEALLGALDAELAGSDGEAEAPARRAERRRTRRRLLCVGGMARRTLKALRGEDLVHFVRALQASALERRRTEREDVRRSVLDGMKEAGKPMMTPMEHLRHMASLRRGGEASAADAQADALSAGARPAPGAAPTAAPSAAREPRAEPSTAACGGAPPGGGAGAQRQPSASGERPATGEAEERLGEISREIQERRPVIDGGGQISTENLRWFAVSVLEVARTASHWEHAWVQLSLPEAQRAEVAAELVRLLLGYYARSPAERLERVGDALAHLSRGGRVKLSVLEVALARHLGATLQRCPSAWQLVSALLLRWFPRPRGHGWGWSRVGWGWAQWWRLSQRALEALPPALRFDALREALLAMEALERAPLREQAPWSGERLAALRARMRELAGLPEAAPGADDEELRARLRGLDLGLG